MAKPREIGQSAAVRFIGSRSHDSWAPGFPAALKRAYRTGFNEARSGTPFRDYSASEAEQGRYELGRQTWLETRGAHRTLPGAIHAADGVQGILRHMRVAPR